MSTLQHKQVKSQKQDSNFMGPGGRGAEGRHMGPRAEKNNRI